MDKCTTFQQGYPGLHTTHNCLSHTGSDLLPFVVLAVMLLLAGTILWYAGRKA